MSDKSDKQNSLIAFAQIGLTAVIALSTGWWAWTTYHNDQARLERQQNRDRFEAQEDAIAEMSRQLGLMGAQCKRMALLNLLDDGPLSTREEGCLGAYLGARSFFFLAKMKISRSREVDETKWNEHWNKLRRSLEDAGRLGYTPETVLKHWQNIINDSGGSEEE